MKAVTFGASGDLAVELARRLIANDWEVDLVTRDAQRRAVERKFSEELSDGRVRLLAVPESYSQFEPQSAYDAHFFMQALFDPRRLIIETADSISAQVSAGLTDQIILTGRLLSALGPRPVGRSDFSYMGSTSAYAGFRDTSVYCAAKHGLLGFVRAMNDEYAETDVRFWLFSMGTVDTVMGAKVQGQDPTSYLRPADVAARIVATVESRSNIHEPEVIMRRRTIRRLGS